MCEVGEYVFWVLATIFFLVIFFNIYDMIRGRRISVECEAIRTQLELALRDVRDTRKQANKFRDEWKVAKIMSDAQKPGEQE